MDINILRRNNLRRLVESYGGQKEFSEAAKVAPNQLNHVMGPNPIRNIGERLARKIELNLGLENGFLDDIKSDFNYEENVTFYNIEINESENLTYIPVKTKNNELHLPACEDGCFYYHYQKDNMESNIQKNDILVIEKNTLNLIDTNVYLFVINQSIELRRVFKMLGGKGYILRNDSTSKTHNFDYEIKNSELNLIKIIGKVKRLIRSIV